jgi:hypothetical protein
MPKNKHRPSKRENFWQAKIKEQQASSLSVSEFCRNNRLSSNRFYWWRKRISERNQTTGGKQNFVPVQVAYGDMGEFSVSALSTAYESSIEILHKSGHKLRVCSGFNPDTLCRVITVLDKISC